MTDRQRRLLAKILWKQVQHNKKIKALEKQVPDLDLSPLRIHLLYDVLEFLGYKDDECDEVLNRFIAASGHHSRMDGFVSWAERNLAKMRTPYN